MTITTAAQLADAQAEKSLPEVCRLSVSDAAEFFSALDLDATGATIAAEAVKEIRSRLQFLKKRRPRLPDARPHGPNPFRRRDAAHPPGRPDRLRAGGRALHSRRTVHRPPSPR